MKSKISVLTIILILLTLISFINFVNYINQSNSFNYRDCVDDYEGTGVDSTGFLTNMKFCRYIDESLFRYYQETTIILLLLVIISWRMDLIKKKY